MTKAKGIRELILSCTTYCSFIGDIEMIVGQLYFSIDHVLDEQLMNDL